MAISKTRAAMVQVGTASKSTKSAPFDGAKKLVNTKAEPVKSTPKPKKVDTETVVGNKGKDIVLPKMIAECADDLYNTRKKRLELQKEVDELQARETALKNKIIDELPKSKSSGISGKIANVKISTKDIPEVEDWNKFYDGLVDSFIKERKKKTGQEYGVFALMQKRIGTKAVEEIWEAGKSVAGVTKKTIKEVSCTKV